MKIYVIYEQFYADFENGEDDAVYLHNSYKNKRKAIKAAIRLVNEEKSYHFMDNDIKNKRNPFKNNNRVDFFKDEEEQTDKVVSVILEEAKLVA